MPAKANHQPSQTFEAAIAAARDALRVQREKLEISESEVANLEVQAAAALARGTQEISIALSLEERIAAELTARPQDAASLATTVGAPVGRVKPIVDRLRAVGKVHNIGSEVEPCWQYAPGDSYPANELRELIRRLVVRRPFSHRELVLVTGARDNRVSGEIANLREEKHSRMSNLGNGSRALWFWLPANVRVAHLPRSTKR
jgi:hypothetical protein